MHLFKILIIAPGRILSNVASSLWANVLRTTDFAVHYSTRIYGHDSITIGKGFHAGPGLWIEAVHSYDGQLLSPVIVIGARVSCSDNVHIASSCRVILGDDVLIGSKVLITDHNHGSYKGLGPHTGPNIPPTLRRLSYEPVYIGDRVFIGDGVVVLPGSVIGEGTVVGSHTVVCGDLPANCLCVGVPARPIRQYDEVSGCWISCEIDFSGSFRVPPTDHVQNSV